MAVKAPITDRIDWKILFNPSFVLANGIDRVRTGVCRRSRVQFTILQDPQAAGRKSAKAIPPRATSGD